jgi:hypothetical protein
MPTEVSGEIIIPPTEPKIVVIEAIDYQEAGEPHDIAAAMGEPLRPPRASS